MNYYYAENYDTHCTYGGKIYNYDFDGYTSMTDIADRIAKDFRFDKQCKRNAELRHRAKVIDNYKETHKTESEG